MLHRPFRRKAVICRQQDNPFAVSQLQPGIQVPNRSNILRLMHDFDCDMGILLLYKISDSFAVKPLSPVIAKNHL